MTLPTLGRTSFIALCAFALLALTPLPPQNAHVQAARFLSIAEKELDRGRYGHAHDALYQALERDPKARRGWQLLAQLGKVTADPDLELWALYREFRLAEARGLKPEERAALLVRIGEVDPTGADLFDLTRRFSEDLLQLAQRYEKEERPHGAIRVYKRLLSLDPESKVALESIERIASAPDPSLAPHATPKDPFEGIDEEFIAKFDAEHASWDNAAKEEREHYITVTNTGYKNLIRTADAMEQVNAFYREFFRYGGADDKRTVPRITVHLFANKDEYLSEGFSPVEWSAGHFTGSHVETFLTDSGFEGVVGTLFHEAAHQFVSLATSASGWLNEGLASFFEGTRIQANGTVIMNLPAGHRLFPLARRMEEGWMKSATDGFDPDNSEVTPNTAPTFRILVENEYEWGPAWYAPTWGLVYFLYNFQDPYDGRFVYRAAFQEFINSSGGRVGKGAIRNFEEVVLANPSKPLTKKRPEEVPELKLPKTVDDLDIVWKDWTLELRDRQSGKVEEALPYLRWAQFAADASMGSEAREHYERALLDDPRNPEALDGLAIVLDEFFDEADRASVLLEQLLRVIEADPNADPLEIANLERRIKKLDPDRRSLTKVEERLLAEAEVALHAYRDSDRPRMVMEWSRRLARDFGEPRFYDLYGEMVTTFGGGIDLWERAYNEENLDGWIYGESVFQPAGESLIAKFGEFGQDQYDYRFLALDRLTSGDFSLEADVEVRRGKGAFAGIVFGQKGTNDFHGAALFPGEAKEGAVDTGFADLFSSFGGVVKTWRHVPVALEPPKGRSVSAAWHKLRLDVTGTDVDVWVDGKRLMTHTFPGREVLLGSFGLLTGPGEARFKSVRFLSRDPLDPAGRVERTARLASAGFGKGEPVGGSYQGLPAPFPEVQRWVQEERTTWAEAGPVPQLLVLFSQHQNDLMPLHNWLKQIDETGKAYGLRIVCVAQATDRFGIDAYLEKHPFPGSVGVDTHYDKAEGLGLTFDRYFISQFSLPRLILIDPLGTVVWEGDPGFKINQPIEPPVESYLDSPLDDLVTKFRLLERKDWQERWNEEGVPALALGDVAGLIDLLKEADAFQGAYSPDERKAQIVYTRLQAIKADPLSAISWVEAEGAHAAVLAIEEWLIDLDHTTTREEKKALNKLRKHKSAKTFATLNKTMSGYLRKGIDLKSKWGGWMGRMRALEAPFAAGRLDELEELYGAGDQEALKEALQQVEHWPREWAAKRLLIP